MQTVEEFCSQRLNIMNNNFSVRFFLLVIFTLSVLLLAPFTGMEFISLGDIINDPFSKKIFVSIRLPRVLTAFCAGAGLALSGMVFQAIFRNPMADPFTLGVASGASCGAAVTIICGLSGTILGISYITLGAFAGSFVSILLVFGLSKLKNNFTPVIMLLAGIAVSFLFSSSLMFIQYISSFRDSFHIIRWLMGGLDIFGYEPLITILIFLSFGAIVILSKLIELDHIMTGDDIARSRGVNITKTKYVLLSVSTLLIGSIVSVCGPIGFVGLMIPHICRMIFASNHTKLGPSVFLLGGTFLVICDTFARTIIAPSELPVGILTSMLGAPFFLWLLIRKNVWY